MFNLFIGILAVLAYPDMLLPEEIQAEFFRKMAPIKPKVGKQNTLIIGLLIGGFLVFQSLDINLKKNEWSIQSKDVDFNTLVVCSTTLLLILGINIKDELLAIAVIVSRNSSAINVLAAKNNISPETLEVTNIEPLEQKDDEKI